MGIETLAIASLGASVASGVAGAAGAQQTAKANAASAQYRAAVARNNAQIAQINAKMSVEAGEAKSTEQSFRTAGLLGQQKVAQAASGLDVNVGTPVDVRASTAELGRLDQLTILHNAAKEAWGYENQANNFMAEAGLQDMTARNAKKAGDISAFTSLLGGATSFTDKWMSYSSRGVF